MFDILDKAAVSYQVVLTKKDEVKGSAREAVVDADIGRAAQGRSPAYPEVLFHLLRGPPRVSPTCVPRSRCCCASRGG